MADCTKGLAYYAWHPAVNIYWVVTVIIIKSDGVSLNRYIMFLCEKLQNICNNRKF